MFGLAIWDNRTQTLILARDRAGEKPLFYAPRRRRGRSSPRSCSASCAIPTSRASSIAIAIAEYLSLGYVPEPRTMFARRPPRARPGRSCASPSDDEETRPLLGSGVVRASSRRSARDAVGETQRLIESAVAKQVMSDVPVGVFISGGLDSSILAALASKFIGVDKVHTFSAQFAEESYDESGDAAVLAQQMRTQHVPVRTDEETLLEALQQRDDARRRAARRSGHPADVPPGARRAQARESDPQRRRRRRAVRRLSDLPRPQDRAEVRRAAVVRARRDAQARRARCRRRGRKSRSSSCSSASSPTPSGRGCERHLRWFGTGLSPSLAAAVDARAADAGPATIR